MQREHISIPKLIVYVLFSVIIFALQTGTFGGMRIFGFAQKFGFACPVLVITR